MNARHLFEHPFFSKRKLWTGRAKKTPSPYLNIFHMVHVQLFLTPLLFTHKGTKEERKKKSSIIAQIHINQTWSTILKLEKHPRLVSVTESRGPA